MGKIAKLRYKLSKRNQCTICKEYTGGICGTCKKSLCGNCVALHFARKHNRNNVHADKIHFPL